MKPLNHPVRGFFRCPKPTNRKSNTMTIYCAAEARSHNPAVTNLDTGGHSSCLTPVAADGECPNRHNHHIAWVRQEFPDYISVRCAGCHRLFRDGDAEMSHDEFSWHPACEGKLLGSFRLLATGPGVLTTTFYRD